MQIFCDGTFPQKLRKVGNYRTQKLVTVTDEYCVFINIYLISSLFHKTESNALPILFIIKEQYAYFDVFFLIPVYASLDQRV